MHKRNVPGSSLMNLPKPNTMFERLYRREFYDYLATELKRYLRFLNIYLADKLLFFYQGFEGSKGILIRNVLIKRGKRNRIFLHFSAMAVLTVGVVVSPFISDTNLFGQGYNLTFAQSLDEQSITSIDVFDTKESDKPRSEIITYTVQNGDTISTIAKKFGVSEDTIKWENGLKSDRITTGDSLRILPVSGIAYKVVRGDTVYTIAKKYSAYAQAIADFPFNDFANPQTFSLVEGQILIVPDGVPPKETPRIMRPRYIAAGPATVSGLGFTWPVRGTLNQGYVWYHPGIDIGAPIGTPVVSATSGTVSEVYTGGWNGGYGTHVIISGSNGYTTLYAHLSGVNVSSGQQVAAGNTVIGWVGLTGRTTGSHLHFEVRGASGFLNPLGLIQ